MSEVNSPLAEFGALLDTHTVRFERLFPGPIERVWAYLTEPDRLRTWLADSTIDLRVGGAVELRFDVDEVPARRKAGAVNRGIVTRYDPPHTLAYTWHHAADATIDSQVIFELETVGERVRLILTHRRLPARVNGSFGAGWHTHLAVLQARLQAETPPPFLALYNHLLPSYVEAARDLPAESA